MRCGAVRSSDQDDRRVGLSPGAQDATTRTKCRHRLGGLTRRCADSGRQLTASVVAVVAAAHAQPSPPPLLSAAALAAALSTTSLAAGTLPTAAIGASTLATARSAASVAAAALAATALTAAAFAGPLASTAIAPTAIATATTPPSGATPSRRGRDALAVAGLRLRLRLRLRLSRRGGEASAVLSPAPGVLARLCQNPLRLTRSVDVVTSEWECQAPTASAILPYCHTAPSYGS